MIWFLSMILLVCCLTNAQESNKKDTSINASSKKVQSMILPLGM